MLFVTPYIVWVDELLEERMTRQTSTQAGPADGLSASLEDYLEAILKLEVQARPARVRDLASELSVHKSTVSAALKSLSEKGLVNYSPYELATLTAEGRRIAEAVSSRHHTIKRFLSEVLGVPDEQAAENACRMEHVIDSDVAKRMVLLAEFAEKSAAGGDDWPSRFVARTRRKTRKRG